jgi:hypothetical protein
MIPIPGAQRKPLKADEPENPVPEHLKAIGAENQKIRRKLRQGIAVCAFSASRRQTSSIRERRQFL